MCLLCWAPAEDDDEYEDDYDKAGRIIFRPRPRRRTRTRET